ncbi:hypothetical protein MMC17_005094 [Xylographa soralifera]|nr:hypothetical protein [Xylographa soralifera]
MSSIRELCNQLGFGPGGQFGVLTQSPFNRSAHAVDDLKYDPSDMLDETRDFLKQYVTPSGQGVLHLCMSQTTLSPEFKRISLDLLRLRGLGSKYWPESTALNPVRWFQWPKDEHRYVRNIFAFISFAKQTFAKICDYLSQILVNQVKNMKKRDTRKFYQVESDSDSVSLSSWVSSVSSLNDIDSKPGTKNNIVDLEDLEMESDRDTVGVGPSELEELPDHKASKCIQHHPFVFSTNDELIAELQVWRKARNNIAPPGARKFAMSELVEHDSEVIRMGDRESETTSLSCSNEYIGWIQKKSDSERLLVKVCSGGNPLDSIQCQGWLGGDLGFAKDLIATAWPLASLSPFFYPKLYPLGTPSRSPENQELLAKVEDTEVRSPTSNGEKPSQHTTVHKTYNLRKKARKNPVFYQSKLKPALRLRPPRRLPVPKNKEHGGLNWQGLRTLSSLKSNQSTETRQAVPTQISSNNLVDNLSSSAPFTRKRLRSRSADTIILNTKRPVSLSARIKFHFFLFEPNLGTIARPASTCDSADAFFDAALAAWKITASDEQLKPNITGVTVSWDGAKRPIFILWEDDENFKNMMLTITKAKPWEKRSWMWK